VHFVVVVWSVVAAKSCWQSSTTSTLFANAFTLITFDVDGTLVKGSGKAAENSAHARAFSYACGKVLGDGRNPVRPVAEALSRHEYHGSTDGLILLRLARATLGIETEMVPPETLEQLFDTMYEYIHELTDEEIAAGIQPLPGVLDTLKTLASMQQEQQQQIIVTSSSSSPKIACGLVTGNVEGIARRKMKAVGILDTGALAPPFIVEQGQKSWKGADDIGFLGGFGSDYCSRNIRDPARNYLDRGEQIVIAAQRCRAMLKNDGTDAHDDRSVTVLSRVVHVGDAPADVLAAKAYSEGKLDGEQPNEDLCIGMVAVATGSYSAEQLREAAGTPIPGRWEPVILEKGMADPNFINACGI